MANKNRLTPNFGEEQQMGIFVEPETCEGVGTLFAGFDPFSVKRKLIDPLIREWGYYKKGAEAEKAEKFARMSERDQAKEIIRRGRVKKVLSFFSSGKTICIMAAFYLLLLALICLCPPWKAAVHAEVGTQIEVELGYAPLWHAPAVPLTPEQFEEGYIVTRVPYVDLARLTLSIVSLSALFGATAIVFVSLATRQK